MNERMNERKKNVWGHNQLPNLVQNDVVVDGSRGVVKDPRAVLGVLGCVKLVKEGGLKVPGGLAADLNLNNVIRISQ